MSFCFSERQGIRMLDASCINQTGIAAGYFTTRHGGVSTGPAASMNCNLYKRYDLEKGQENFRLFCGAIGVDPATVITNRLTAGTNLVRRVSAEDLVGYDLYDEPAAPRADGLITNDPKVTLFLYSADCALIQLLDPVHRAIGAFHAGWAGSLNGIIPNTVQAMTEAYGSDPKDLIAAICPSIGTCCFEVGDEVADKFRVAGFGEYVIGGYAKPHVDLRGVNAAVLEQAGLRRENIHISELCTYCQEALFHSYRRGPVDAFGAHLNGMNGMFLKLI